MPDQLRVCQSADLIWAIFPTVIPLKLPEIIELGTYSLNKRKMESFLRNQ